MISGMHNFPRILEKSVVFGIERISFVLEVLKQVKFFTSDSNWIWYASKFDGEDIFFGLVSRLEVELGYFSLKELEEVKGSLGLPIERDLYFEPKSLKELQEMHQKERDESLDPDS
jgi:hypothetical protein